MFGKLKLVHQFMVLAIVALLVVVALAVLRFQQNAKLDRLLGQQTEFLQVRNRLLRIERRFLQAHLAQSQFIYSHQPRYHQTFEQHLKFAIDSLQQLLQDKPNQEEILAPLKVLLKIIEKYSRSVDRVAKIQTIIGKHQSTGDFGRLQQLISDIQSRLYPLDKPRLLADFTRLQLYEKDFAATLDMRLANQLQNQSEAFQKALQNANLSVVEGQELLSLSQTYYENVSALIANTLSLELAIAEADVQFDRLFPQLNETRDSLQEQLLTLSESIRQQQQNVMQETILIFGIAFVLLGIFALFQINNAQAISARLHQLADGMQSIGQGNFKTVVLPRGNDEIGMLSVTFLDMSQQLEQQMETIRQNTEELRAAKENAEQANLLKDKFVSLVAHDLRSPLSGMLAALDYMHTDEETPLVEEHQEVVGRLLKIGYDLTQMTEDVLNVSRLRTGKIRPTLTSTSLRELVEQVISRCNYLADQKGVALINDLPADIILNVDSALYSEVVQNLTSNGIKFCNRGGHIRFSLAPDSQTDLVVTDTGQGIPQELQAKLFQIEEKTVRVGTAGESGTGFGLPLSYDIMQAHGGTIEVESEEGQGASFRLVMPTSSLIISESSCNKQQTT